MQFKSQKLLLNGRCCAQTLKNHNFHPHLSIGGGKNRMKGGFAKALGKSVDRSQPLFYFVPQDSHSQAGSTRKVSIATLRILSIKGYLAPFADKRNLKKITSTFPPPPLPFFFKKGQNRCFV